MPITSRGFARSSLAFLVVGLIALLAIVGTTVGLVERTQSYFEEVVEAREIRAAAVEVRNLLLDAQTGQRGFLLTGEEDYLSPYEEARGAVLPAFQTLGRLLEAYPEAEAPMARMGVDIRAKLEELDETVALARAGDIEAALAIVQTDEGERIMDDTRLLLDAIIDAADARSFEGVVEQRGAAAALRLVALIGAVVIIVVAGGSVLTVLRYTRDLDRARTEVETLNADLEERVDERTRELQRANEEVQHFAYIVTHDLRAPLVNIMGFTSELEASLRPITALVEAQQETRQGEDADDPVFTEARQAANADIPEAIGFIRSSTRKMDALINAILKIAREGKRQLKAERIELGQMLETIAAAIQHQIAATEGEITFDIRTPPLYTDRLSLEQIFGNLFDNAVKYRHPARALHIAVKAHQDARGRIVVAVADNGRGIAPEDHARVFELFRRSGSQDQTGEGIGLSHVRIMVRNLGGDITLQSTPGEGATFTVTLAPDLRALTRK